MCSTCRWSDLELQQGTTVEREKAPLLRRYITIIMPITVMIKEMNLAGGYLLNMDEKVFISGEDGKVRYSWCRTGIYPEADAGRALVFRPEKGQQ